MNNTASFLGTGWSFPPAFDATSRTVSMVSDEEDINQSLTILLSTSLRERVMQPQYGCNLSDFQFETLNSTMIGKIKDLVERAILFYEPRITVSDITITEADSPDLLEGLLLIGVDYTIITANSRFNYVYKFYLTESDPSAQR